MKKAPTLTDQLGDLKKSDDVELVFPSKGFQTFWIRFFKMFTKKSRIQETLNLKMDADSITIAMKKRKKLNGGKKKFG